MRLFRPLFLTVLLLVASLLAPHPLPAQTASAPLGQVAASFGFRASRLLADPVRPRMYAAVAKTNSINVIDTHTLQVIASVYIGPNPVDLSISPDGNTLYSANRDSTVSAIGALDLNTLQALPSLPLPNAPYSIAAGLDGRLYVSTGDLLQVDAATGTVQATIDTGNYYDGALQISPDGKTLYVGTGGIQSIDVSTPTATVLQANGYAYDRGVNSLRISHDGKSICGSNDSYGDITLYAATDLNSFYGRFDLGGDDGGGPLAFSSDDAVFYAVTDHLLRVYSARTFVQSTSLLIPVAAGYDPLTHDEDYIAYDLATDSTDSFLFIGQSNSAIGDNTIALTTGRGPLTPPGPLPTVRLTSATPQLHVSGGQPGRFTLTRTGDLSQPLTVQYKLIDTSANSAGYDNGYIYKYLPGAKTFKAGHATVNIKVTPQQSEYYFITPYVVKLQLQASGFYSIGKGKAKITLEQ